MARKTATNPTKIDKKPKARELFAPEERLNYADAFVRVDQKPIDMDFWQEAFLMDTSRYSCTLKSRRTGFSFDVGLKGMIKANDPARFKYVRQFVSYNEDDAKEKINYVKEFYHSIPKKHRKPLVSETKTTMEFLDVGGKTTSRLISIACRPPRGRGGDIVFDEMAIYPQNKASVIYTAGLPVITRGGCIEIGSTPLGSIGKFYEIFAQKKDYPEFTRFTVPWWFAKAICENVEEAVKLAPHMDTKDRVEIFGKPIIKTIYNSMPEGDFQQEYECMFIDSAQSYITLDLLMANTPGMREGDRTRELIGGDIDNDKDIEPEEEIEVQVFKDTDSLILGYDPAKHGRLYLGYDVARRRDAAVIFIIGHLPNGKKLSIAEIEMRDKTFECQRDQIRKIMRNLPVVRGCIDQSGQGEDTTEILQREFGRTKLEGVIFGVESKEVMAIAVRTGLEKREFILQNNDKFRRQCHAIKRIPTSGGAFRYDSARDEQGHADSFWAWALAYHAITPDGGRVGFYEQLKEKKENTEKSDTPKRAKSREAVLRKMLRGVGNLWRQAA
jgi:phage FluMu gp28-like protein